MRNRKKKENFHMIYNLIWWHRNRRKENNLIKLDNNREKVRFFDIYNITAKKNDVYFIPINRIITSYIVTRWLLNYNIQLKKKDERNEKSIYLKLTSNFRHEISEIYNNNQKEVKCQLLTRNKTKQNKKERNKYLLNSLFFVCSCYIIMKKHQFHLESLLFWLWFLL